MLSITHTNTQATYTHCTIADVEESEACAREIRSWIFTAETLHVVVGSNGFLYRCIFARQPAPLLHTAIQTGVHL